MAARSMFEKVWDDHMVGDGLLFIDLHLVHEVTSPQAFEGLRLAGRRVRRPDLTLAVADHNLPTTKRGDRNGGGARGPPRPLAVAAHTLPTRKRVDANGARLPIADRDSAAQLAALEANVA